MQALALTHELAALSAEHGLAYWQVWADFTQGRLDVGKGDSACGVARMRQAIAAMQSGGGKVGTPYFLCELAEAELSRGQPVGARSALKDASSLMSSDGNALYMAEALRLEGRVALTACRDPQRGELAEQRFISALNVARRQGARALALRAATNLARLWADGGQCARAAELLRPIHLSFDEGLDTSDLVQAKNLLQEVGRLSGSVIT